MSETCVVPVGEYSFTQANDRGIYARPETRRGIDCTRIAFYRTKPISAITHHAEVLDVTKGSDQLTQMDRLRMFPEQLNKSVTVFEIDDLSEFETPVRGEKQGIQGPMYLDLSRLQSAELVSSLF